MLCSIETCSENPDARIGIGLRHEHYDEALASPDEVDFVEIHAENFYVDGGLALFFLDALKDRLPISVHGTALGLASQVAIPAEAITAFKRLIDRVDPTLVSDHAAFCWSGSEERPRHSGDLLPVQFNAETLHYLIQNLDRVQQTIGRQILIENLSAYVAPGVDSMHEYELLQQACYRSGAGLLLDINNLYVNSFNNGNTDHLSAIKQTIDMIDPALVGEIHLAGCGLPKGGELMIDDHSRPVPDIVWSAYEYALKRFGPAPTLVEWDTNLPTWPALVDEAMIAHGYMHEVCGR